MKVRRQVRTPCLNDANGKLTLFEQYMKLTQVAVIRQLSQTMLYELIHGTFVGQDPYDRRPCRRIDAWKIFSKLLSWQFHLWTSLEPAIVQNDIQHHVQIDGRAAR